MKSFSIHCYNIPVLKSITVCKWHMVYRTFSSPKNLCNKCMHTDRILYILYCCRLQSLLWDNMKYKYIETKYSDLRGMKLVGVAESTLRTNEELHNSVSSTSKVRWLNHITICWEKLRILTRRCLWKWPPGIPRMRWGQYKKKSLRK